MRKALLIPLILIALLGAAFAATTAIAAKDPKAPKACNKPRIEPTKIVITCADFGLYVDSIEWKYWGNERAKGSGTFVEECTPGSGCVGQRTYFTKLTLQKVRTRNCDGYHGKMFKTLKLNFPRTAPAFHEDVRKNRLFCNDK
jgi:hypothetical protein